MKHHQFLPGIVASRCDGANSSLVCGLLALISAFLLSLSVRTSAENFTISIAQPDGAPLAGAVIALEPTAESSLSAPDPGVMDQINRQFAPHILVVQKGAEVSFPNSDSIKHHVYSFSRAKPFEIKLYKDSKGEKVVFEKAGEVELGCNVHDWMLGYVYVVDTPFFGRSDNDGEATISAPAGSYTVTWWHPRIKDKEADRKANLPEGRHEFSVVIKQTLLPPYEQESLNGAGDYD
ncbi:MAG: methylamine utilization protein [Pseudomonadota bacterium]